MRVLVVPKWYPWSDRPVLGIFCREQARPLARVQVVGNVVDTDVFHPAPPGGGGSEPATGGTQSRRLLTVAALAEKKGHADLLQALAELHRHRRELGLDLVGDGELRTELQ